MKTSASRLTCLAFALCLGLVPSPAVARTKTKNDPAQLRTAYINRVREEQLPPAIHTMGSLWSPGADLDDLSTDYKAHKLNDTVVIQVAVQTTAAQTGDVKSQRTFQTSSAITGLAGAINTKGLNPLFNANSSTALQGTGATDSSTTFQTALTAHVIAVLPSGNLVVEAQRNIFMNNQHEDVTVRGVIRPNDIGSNNTISSAQLSDLQIELKGKGIIADSVRPPNAVTRALLWLFGF